MSEHFDTAPGFPQTRAEVEAASDEVLDDLMGRCHVDPGEPDECLACYAYAVAIKRDEAEKPKRPNYGGGDLVPRVKRLAQYELGEGRSGMIAAGTVLDVIEILEERAAEALAKYGARHAMDCTGTVIGADPACSCGLSDLMLPRRVAPMTTKPQREATPLPITDDQMRAAMSRAGVWYDSTENRTFFPGTPDKVAGTLTRSLKRVVRHGAG